MTDPSRNPLQRRQGGIAGHVPAEQPVTFAGIRSYHAMRFRTAFGDLALRSPRWIRCACDAPGSPASFSPLARLLINHTAPELEYLGALVVGLLLSPFAARLLPFGWDAGVAASILGTDRWNAGQQLMKSSNSTGWATLAAEITLAEANHDALSARRAAAVQAKKEQRCTIVVPAP